MEVDAFSRIFVKIYELHQPQNILRRAGNINGEIVDGSVLACLIKRVYRLIFLIPDVEGMQQGVATMNSLSTASEECLQLWTDGDDSQACLADAQLGHPLFK